MTHRRSLLAASDAERARHIFGSVDEIAAHPNVQHDEQTGCLLWTSPQFNSGYGAAYAFGRTVRVHRMACLLAYPESSPEGKVVRHLCHRRACVNPNHLAWGTHKDNARDSSLAGRIKGQQIGNKQMSSFERRVILRLAETTLPFGKIAFAVGRSHSTVVGLIRSAQESGDLGEIPDRPTLRTPNVSRAVLSAIAQLGSVRVREVAHFLREQLPDSVSVHNAVSRLTMQGRIQRVGFGRYEITEAGRGFLRQMAARQSA